MECSGSNELPPKYPPSKTFHGWELPSDNSGRTVLKLLSFIDQTLTDDAVLDD